jgi:hypothetical protein
MLQNQGWSEGEGLGASSSTSRGDDDAHTTTYEDKARKRKRTRTRTGMGLDRRLSPPRAPSPSREQATEEHQVILVDDDDDDDPIIELRKKVHVPVIDLTQSDTEEDDQIEEEEEEGSSDDAPAPPASTTTTTTDHSAGGTSTGTTPSDSRAAQTALLTPLPTILKSDRLGIGLKAKTEGPYRSSVKRVTHNAAALAAHLKTAEDMRRTQRQLGRGHRAFTRAERIERERRQNMMAYLSEP